MLPRNSDIAYLQSKEQCLSVSGHESFTNCNKFRRPMLYVPDHKQSNVTGFYKEAAGCGHLSPLPSKFSWCNFDQECYVMLFLHFVIYVRIHRARKLVVLHPYPHKNVTPLTDQNLNQTLWNFRWPKSRKQNRLKMDNRVVHLFGIVFTSLPGLTSSSGRR